MTNIPMRRVSDVDGQPPGSFEIEVPNEWNKGHIWFICPRGKHCGVGIRSGEFKDGVIKRWGFDGNADKPTLTPSINCNGPAGCGWHGHITKGEMTNPPKA